MPERRLTEESADACQRLLAQLPGVFAAGIGFEAGELREIHILATNARGAKQIVRDVQSAIFAVYGQEVDHRIISVAQLSRDPAVPEAAPDAPRPVRLQIAEIEVRRQGGCYSARICLSDGDAVFSGEARSSDASPRRVRAIAQATLAAVHAFLGEDAFDLLDVKRAEFGGEPVTVVVVEQLGGRQPRLLVGAALEGEDLAGSVVRGTLDAVNRRVGALRGKV